MYLYVASRNISYRIWNTKTREIRFEMIILICIVCLQFKLLVNYFAYFFEEYLRISIKYKKDTYVIFVENSEY